MTVIEMAEKLSLDQEVIEAVAECDQQIEYEKIQDICSDFLTAAKWEGALERLREYCGDDPQGMKALTVDLHCLTKTYKNYLAKGIPEKIFLDTMGFIPRFLSSHKKNWGVSAYTWAWWFPRQLSMNEFRIGEYEYEFLEENGEKKINLHIPSDADLGEGNICMVYPFLEEFYPEYKNAPIVCDSWLLSPALKKLLPHGSNIIRFQEQFEVLNTDWDSPWFMDWVFGRHDMPVEELPEKTILQRNMKRHLLEGGKVGSSYGVRKPS